MILILVNNSSFAIDQRDSLQKLFISENTDLTQRSMISVRLAEEWLKQPNQDSAIYFAEYAINFGSQLNIPDAVIGGSYLMVRIMLMNDSLNESIPLIEHAMKYIDSAQDKDKALAFMLNAAYIYDSQEKFYEGRKLYIKGMKIANDEKLFSRLWSFYNNLANQFNGLHEYDSALVYLHKSLKLYELLSESERNFSIASVYSNLGLNYMNNKDFEKAEYYFKLALDQEDIKMNYYGMYSVYLNLGAININKGNYNSAEYDLKMTAKYLDSIGGQFQGYLLQLKIVYLVHMGKLKFYQKNYTKSLSYYEEAMEMARGKADNEIKPDDILMVANIYKELGNIEKALQYSFLYAERLEAYNQKKYSKDLTSLMLEYKISNEILKSKKDLEIAKLNDNRNQLLYFAIIMTTIGMIGILVFVVLLQKSKLKRRIAENQNIKLEQEIISNELNAKTKELTTSVMYLAKKNEFINLISQKLKLLKSSISKDKQEIITQIIKELDNSSKDDNWKEFETLFMKVNSEFYASLTRSFPNLTSNDLRLCAFIRLNMSNKEISALTFQSVDSLKMARHRLRKKLNLESGENLNSFLNQL